MKVSGFWPAMAAFCEYMPPSGLDWRVESVGISEGVEVLMVVDQLKLSQLGCQVCRELLFVFDIQVY